MPLNFRLEIAPFVWYSMIFSNSFRLVFNSSKVSSSYYFSSFSSRWLISSSSIFSLHFNFLFFFFEKAMGLSRTSSYPREVFIYTCIVFILIYHIFNCFFNYIYVLNIR